LSLIFCITATSSAFASSQENTQSAKGTYSSELRSAKGEVIGIQTITTQKKEDTSGVEVTVTENKQYKISPQSPNQKEYEKIYTDSQKTTVFKITKDKKFYINGTELSDKDLHKPVAITNKNDVMMRSLLGASEDTGGYGPVCNYSSSDWSWVLAEAASSFLPSVRADWLHNAAILVGNGLYTIGNYAGHKYFTFRTHGTDNPGAS